MAPMGQLEGKLPGREAPARAPATLIGSSPFPATNWHIFICKGKSWAGAHMEEWESLCDDGQPSHLHRGPKRPAIRGMHACERAVLASKA